MRELLSEYPMCPRCGCPAQALVLLKARVVCVIRDDGSAGKVLYASREQAQALAYQCGGGHEWALGSSPLSGPPGGVSRTDSLDGD